MKTSLNGINLLKEFEGFRSDAYPDPATGGEPWTIGYGHTSAAGSPHVFRGMKITERMAGEMLTKDLLSYEAAVMKACVRPPNQNEFDAMVSLCFNIGPGNFAKSSVVSYFNAKKKEAAADSFKLWNKANKKVMEGLTRRRAREAKLFLTPVMAEPLPPPPDIDPDTDMPDVGSAPPKGTGKPSIQTVMIGVIVAIAAAIGAYFGLGR